MALDTQQKRGSLIGRGGPCREWLASPSSVSAKLGRQSLVGLFATVSVDGLRINLTGLVTCSPALTGVVTIKPSINRENPMSVSQLKKQYLYVGNDNEVMFGGVQDADGNFVSNATVSMTLADPASPTVNLLGSAVTLSYVTGSNGRYRGVIQSTVALVAGVTYDLVITATVAGDADTSIRISAEALTRTT